MIRNLSLITARTLTTLMMAAVLAGCDTPVGGLLDGAETEPQSGTDTTPSGGGGGAEVGVLTVKALADGLGAAARSLPNGRGTPDDVDVSLTPTEYTVAFKRLVLRQVDEATEQTLAEVEIFDADTAAEALVVDLLDSVASDVLDVEELAAGTYNKIDVEVFYLDMTVPTLYPGAASHDIGYRMVFEEMGVLEPRDFLLYLEPSWMEAGSDLADSVTQAGWYWMQRADPDHVEPGAGAAAHPAFNVLDLFADEEFWSSERKVLEGGRIDPPLEYDPAAGGVLTISFDVTGTFNFKDYYDDSVEPDGLWEIRRDSGIHPFLPAFDCTPEVVEPADTRG